MHQLRSRLTSLVETRTHHPGLDVVFVHRVKDSLSIFMRPALRSGLDMNFLVVIIKVSQIIYTVIKKVVREGDFST